MTLRELADRLGCRLEGDGAIEITGVAGLEDAGPGDLSFFANPTYAAALSTTRASAVILGEAQPRRRSSAPGRNPCPRLRGGARSSRATAPARGVHPTSVIAPDAVLGTDVSIGPFVVIGSRAHSAIARCSIRMSSSAVAPASAPTASCIRTSQCGSGVIGARVILQDGAVIGSDGYGFVSLPDGTHRKIPQRAIVVLEDDVEIGANTTVDRPAVGETRIAAGTKIDNLVQIAHGVRVGAHSLLAAQVGIAGSTTLGDHVTLAGQVGVAGHITIGDHVVATDRHPERCRAARARVGVRHSESRVAEGVRARQAPAGAAPSGDRARRATRGARSTARDGGDGRVSACGCMP